ncbi:MAG TPA: type II toxin-antitoxin system RelE/ParE family toxin [Longimicrobiaceae bacterium]
MRITWSEQAASDVVEIRTFIAHDAPAFAELFVDRILHAVDHLADFPRSGRKVPELGRSDLREVLMGSYRIVYQIRNDAISILAVVHTARLFGPEHLRDRG